MAKNKLGKVALIVGHSQNQQGAQNARTGMTEFLFNEKLATLISYVIEHELAAIEVDIVYRTGPYSELPTAVNKTQANIAISLHCNAFNKKATGTETLHFINSVEGKRLATLIQAATFDVMQSKDRGIKPCDVGHIGKAGDRGGHLLKYTNMPCVISEPFFIDIDDELYSAELDIMELANSYAYAICEYLEQK